MRSFAMSAVREEKRTRKSIQKTVVRARDAQELVASIFSTDLHARRVESLANGALGVTAAGALNIHAIGRGLASAASLTDKHSIKQVDRLLSNRGIDVWALARHWVSYVLGARKSVFINLDWTEFDKDGHSMLVASAQTGHGRATPLLWKSHEKSTLAGNRNAYEDALLIRLHALIPDDVEVTIVADRGFCDTKLFELIDDQLGWQYVIRVRSNIHVEASTGERKKAGEWRRNNGRMRTLTNAKITQQEHEVAAFVVVKDKAMKEPWCLVSN
jgi:hypothetical protein